MESTDIKVKIPQGVHLRIAAKIVEKSRNYKSRIQFIKGALTVEGDSILGLVLLEAVENSDLRIVAIGEDEKMALKDMEQFFSDGGGI